MLSANQYKQNNLLDLPPDILITEILSYLNTKSLFTLRESNHKGKSLAEAALFELLKRNPNNKKLFGQVKELIKTATYHPTATINSLLLDFFVKNTSLTIEERLQGLSLLARNHEATLPETTVTYYFDEALKMLESKQEQDNKWVKSLKLLTLLIPQLQLEQEKKLLKIFWTKLRLLSVDEPVVMMDAMPALGARLVELNAIDFAVDEIKQQLALREHAPWNSYKLNELHAGVACLLMVLKPHLSSQQKQDIRTVIEDLFAYISKEVCPRYPNWINDSLYSPELKKALTGLNKPLKEPNFYNSGFNNLFKKLPSFNIADLFKNIKNRFYDDAPSTTHTPTVKFDDIELACNWITTTLDDFCLSTRLEALDLLATISPQLHIEQIRNIFPKLWSQLPYKPTAVETNAFYKAIDALGARIIELSEIEFAIKASKKQLENRINYSESQQLQNKLATLLLINKLADLLSIKQIERIAPSLFAQSSVYDSGNQYRDTIDAIGNRLIELNALPEILKQLHQPNSINRENLFSSLLAISSKLSPQQVFQEVLPFLWELLTHYYVGMPYDAKNLVDEIVTPLSKLGPQSLVVTQLIEKLNARHEDVTREALHLLTALAPYLTEESIKTITPTLEKYAYKDKFASLLSFFIIRSDHTKTEPSIINNTQDLLLSATKDFHKAIAKKIAEQKAAQTSAKGNENSYVEKVSQPNYQPTMKHR